MINKRRVIHVVLRCFGSTGKIVRSTNYYQKLWYLQEASSEERQRCFSTALFIYLNGITHINE